MARCSTLVSAVVLVLIIALAPPVSAQGAPASQISFAVGLKAVTLYAVRDSFSRGVEASLSSPSIASGIAMNGMRVSGRTKQAYGSPRAAA